jgi:diguanylate cyclase (GGDEF)-like protein
LVSIRADEEELRLSFAAQLALMYLKEEGIVIETTDDAASTVKFGRATIEPLQPNDGGYVRIDDGGYQIMLNYRGTQDNFLTVSMSDVMAGRIPPDLLRDRIAIVGPTAASLKEKYNTPYSNSIGKSYKQMSSLVIHANLTSQLLSAALDNRQIFRFLPEPMEWGLVVVWSSVGIFLSYHGWRLSQFHNHLGYGWSLLLGYTALVCIAPPAVGYVAFLNGWWIPVVSPLVGALTGVVMVAAYKTHALQRLATCDGLTQVANRRYFDLYLHRTWLSSQRRQRSLSLILCDVDYFKAYNDNYGHRQGDVCLQKIAEALSHSVRHSDLVARYGGEEFAVILPDTQIEDAVRVAQRVGESVRSLQLPHQASEIAPHVTLSCGVASFVPQGWATPYDLIQAADSALYEAKDRGRNTYALRQL